MRDVSHKVDTLRTATAAATLRASPATVEMIRTGNLPKGDALTVAKVAGIQAAKSTAALIPYCHPIPIDFVEVRFDFEDGAVEVVATVKAIYRTGVEMEALTAASIAALTLYDMTKMIDEEVVIESVRLVEKRGGKSDFPAPTVQISAAVVTVSDSASAGEREDLSGPTVASVLVEHGVEIAETAVVSDDPAEIQSAVRGFVSRSDVSLVVLTGGTGVGPRDRTPEAIGEILDRELPGVAERIRSYGQDRTPFAMLSRSVCGVAGDTLVLCLPGSPKAAEEGLRAVMPHLLHAVEVVRGAGHETVATQEEGNE